MKDLFRFGATELARRIRAREVSSVEVVRAHLERIEAVNSKLNALTVVLADEALTAAEACDRALAEGRSPLGPLHGVPMTVKENIDLAGTATTEGIVALAQSMPASDGPHVLQLRAAGAIPIARSNMPDFGLRWHTDNALRGTTLNPWDRSRTPGGSSGGEAAALATGMTPLGNGNDLGGSLRWPSQCCGTTAIRPTLGRVPWHHATLPGEPPICLQLMAVEGPMARHVRDLRTALRAMSRPDPRDPTSVPAPLDWPKPEPPVRVAVTFNPSGLGVDPQVADGVRRAANALAAAGYAIEELEPPAVAEAHAVWQRLVLADARLLWSMVGTMASPGARAFMEATFQVEPEADLTSYQMGLGARLGLLRLWAQFQARTPLILGPVATIRPFPVGRDLEGIEAVREISLAMRLTVAANLLGLPAVAVPVGVAEGLPQAVQVIGPAFREDLCLDAAEAIEERLGVITPIDVNQDP